MRDDGLEAELPKEIAGGFPPAEQAHHWEGRERLRADRQILLEPEILQAILEVIYRGQKGQ